MGTEKASTAYATRVYAAVGSSGTLGVHLFSVGCRCALFQLEVSEAGLGRGTAARGQWRRGYLDFGGCLGEHCQLNLRRPSEVLHETGERRLRCRALW